MRTAITAALGLPAPTLLAESLEAPDRITVSYRIFGKSASNWLGRRRCKCARTTSSLPSLFQWNRPSDPPGLYAAQAVPRDALVPE